MNAIENSPYRDFYYVDFFTGLRRSELLALRWPQIVLEGKGLSVVAGLHRIPGTGLVLTEPKNTASRRRVTIPQDVVDVLRRIRVARMEQALGLGEPFSEAGFVFCRTEGTPLLPEWVSKDFRKRLADAGLDGIRLHDL